MKKFLLAAVCLTLWMSPVLYGIAEAPAPVRDGAAVLATQTQDDANKLIRMVESKTGLHIAVEIRHFLGGAEPGDYARRLLRKLPDPENSVLLLIVVGEESYSLEAGLQADKVLGKDIRDTLLSKYFRVPFLNRQYDQAVGNFLLGMAEALGKETGEGMNLQGLFGYTLPQATTSSQENKGVNILDFMLGESVSTKDQAAANIRAEREEKGLGLGSIIIIGLVLSSIFSKRGHRKGCGCSPLSWIFGVFGISKLIGRRR